MVIMQRLHDRDMAGHIMELPEFAQAWQHVCVPMEWEPDRMRASVYMQDPRTKPGQLMWPELFPKPMVDVLKLRLGEYGTAGQMQQRPSPPGGGVLKVGSFRLWPASAPLPDLEFVVQSYDTAFTEKTENDPCACSVWGIFTRTVKKGDAVAKVACALLLDAWDERLGYPALREKVMDDYRSTYGGTEQGGGFKIDHPPRGVDLVLVEEKGSGISLLQDLSLANVPCKAYNPGAADKLARAHMAAPLLELGVLYVLESSKESDKPISWARPFLKQLEQFNKAEHDDYVDTFTQAVLFFKMSGMLVLPAVPQDAPKEKDYNAARKRGQNPYFK
jgi:phage terminase large subunit-like protein